MFNIFHSQVAEIFIQASGIYKILEIKRYFIKRKIVPVKAMKTYRWNRDIAPLTLNQGTRWR
jgi:hypothetical protein